MRGWLRAMVCVPKLYPADPMANAKEIMKNLRQADAQGIDLVIFPELALTGASLGDLYRSDLLLQESEKALQTLAEATKDLHPLAVLGAPVRRKGSLQSALFLLHQGSVEDGAERPLFASKGVPKRTQSAECSAQPTFRILEFSDPLVRGHSFRLAVCFSSDLRRGNYLDALLEKEVDILCVPAAVPYAAGSEKQQATFLKQVSSRGLACLLASAGEDESGSDFFYAGECWIEEGGEELFRGGILGRSDIRYGKESTKNYVDLDLDRLWQIRQQHRLREMNSIHDDTESARIRPVAFSGWRAERNGDTLDRPISPKPFVPERLEERDEIWEIQTRGLLRRMRHLKTQQVWIGLSGGLDSTLAALVALRAFEEANWDKKGIHLVSMPAFGTGTRTRSNASKFGELSGCDFREISLTSVLKQHFQDIGLPLDNRSVAFENAQARERTQILMDLANLHGGLQVGTGDLSEAALGWSTYNGDQMSMYNPNATIPKTLAQALVADEAQRRPTLQPILADILATPISPELLPEEKGGMAQKTEEIIGPYELHDFFLYYFLYYGYEPRKIVTLAERAFEGRWDRRTILRILRIFFQRFFAGQFKRSSAPEGVATGAISFSPRAGWQMPSDISGECFLREMDRWLSEARP